MKIEERLIQTDLTDPTEIALELESSAGINPYEALIDFSDTKSLWLISETPLIRFAEDADPFPSLRREIFVSKIVSEHSAGDGDWMVLAEEVGVDRIWSDPVFTTNLVAIEHSGRQERGFRLYESIDNVDPLRKFVYVLKYSNSPMRDILPQEFPVIDGGKWLNECLEILGVKGYEKQFNRETCFNQIRFFLGSLGLEYSPEFEVGLIVEEEEEGAIAICDSQKNVRRYNGEVLRQILERNYRANCLGEGESDYIGIAKDGVSGIWKQIEPALI